MCNTTAFSSFIILENRKKGIMAELIMKKIYQDRGSKVIVTNKGSDFLAINSLGTNQKYHEYVEVKTGNSRQTRAQKKTMREVISKGDNYTIHYLSNEFLRYYMSGRIKNEM